MIYYSVYYVYHLILKEAFEKMSTQDNNFYIREFSQFILLEIINAAHILGDITRRLDSSVESNPIDIREKHKLLWSIRVVREKITKLLRDTTQTKAKATVRNAEALCRLKEATDMDPAKVSGREFYIIYFGESVRDTEKDLTTATDEHNSIVNVLSEIKETEMRIVKHTIKV